MKRNIFKVSFLLLTAGQVVSTYAMLSQMARRLVASQNLAEQHIIQNHKHLSSMAALRTYTSQHNTQHEKHDQQKEKQSDSNANNQSWWQRWRKIFAIGSLATAGAFACSAQKNTCFADETKEPYDHDFLRKAGFIEGLPYWYLGQFATKFNNATIGTDLKIKIYFSSDARNYQPDYLLPHESKAIWNGQKWISNTDYFAGNTIAAPGIKIAITNKENEDVASCYLSGAGKLSNIWVTHEIRGKGYGSMLLSAAKQIALECGIHEIYIHVFPYSVGDNNWHQAFDPTVRFYQKNGFIGDRMFCADCAKVDREIYSNYSRMVCKTTSNTTEHDTEAEPHIKQPCDHKRIDWYKEQLRTQSHHKKRVG